MDHFKKIDTILHQQKQSNQQSADIDLLICYARMIAKIENVIAVVSDLSRGTSSIFNGAFAGEFGLDNYCTENSIWEREIIDLMSESEQNHKYISELRFFHFVRHLPRSRRSRYYLAARLRFHDSRSVMREVLHRMYYIFDQANEHILYALCIYGPMTFVLPGDAVAIDSVTGQWEELGRGADGEILSRREKQVLSCVDAGMTTAEIAGRFNISPHTVSRHRQEIIAKLQVKNSIEACRIAKSMKLI